MTDHIEVIQLADLPAEDIKQFLVEGEHGSWDGWDENQVQTIEAFIIDLEIGVTAMAEIRQQLGTVQNEPKYVWQVEIIARHDFNRTVHLSHHRTEDGATKTGNLKLMVAQSGDEPEWANSYELNITRLELMD